MDKTFHISDADLILFEDRELPAKSVLKVETHLERCSVCQKRLQQLQRGISAYKEYREGGLQSSLPWPKGKWPSLRTGLAEIDRAEGERSFWFAPKLLWSAVAFACALLITNWYLGKRAEQPSEMRQLLADSAALPPVPHARLSLTANGRRWMRPAVLRPDEEMFAAAPDRATLDHIQTLFVKAHYSWEDPLSARSFARWRDQLPEKQDQVTTIRDERGRKRFYRLQTKTSASILHTASLTLRADNSRTVNADFKFAGAENVELAEQPPDMERDVRTRNTPAPRPKAIETLATPEEELRVFAALSAIDADGEDPIEVSFDRSRQHVLVTGIGLPPARRKEVEEALRNLPNTVVNFDSGQIVHAGKEIKSNADTYSADVNSPFRQTLESKAGGTQQLQTITDRALEASNKLFARSHALLVLAQKFPPAVERTLGTSGQITLRTLRQRHAFTLKQTALQLGEALKPLLNSSAAAKELPAASSLPWQQSAEQLFATARNLDGTVSRLLTAPSEEAGEKALFQLPNDLEKAEQLANAQATGNH
jgi:hypothetical protein